MQDTNDVEYVYTKWVPNLPQPVRTKTIAATETSKTRQKRKITYVDSSDTESGEIRDTLDTNRQLGKRTKFGSAHMTPSIPIWTHESSTPPISWQGGHHDSRKSTHTQPLTTQYLMERHYKQPVLLSQEEQKVLLDHYITTKKAQAERKHWNEYPNYTPSQLAEFNTYDWNKRVYAPFKILMDKRMLAVALRFLAYVPLAPEQRPIPSYVFDHTKAMGIGGTVQDIVLFFRKDLTALQTPSLNIRRSTRHSDYELDRLNRQRSDNIQHIMRFYAE
jgi:hypothetical protein